MDNRAINLSPTLDPSAAPQVLDRAILFEEVRRLSVVSNTRSALAIGLQWAVILMGGAAAIYLHHWGAYVLAAIVIGTRQHALLVLMHDAAHYRLFSRRWVNDFLSDFFLALPLGLSTSVYRRTHLAHHRCLNADEDPDRRAMGGDAGWHWPKPRRQGLRTLALDLLGVNSLATLKTVARWSPWPRMFKPPGSDDALPLARCILPLVLLLIVPVGVIFTHLWLAFLVLWVVPAFTLLPAIFRLRTIGEHGGTANEHELNASRSIRATWFERLVLAPCNVNYHLEHHLFPSVAWFNLGRLHRRLMQEPGFRERAHRTGGYLHLSRGVLGELCLANGGAVKGGADKDGAEAEDRAAELA